MAEAQSAEQQGDVSLKQRLVKHGLWFFIVLSLVVHLTGISPVIIEKLIPEKQPKPESQCGGIGCPACGAGTPRANQADADERADAS